jgi:hypothetical protein
MLNFRFNFSGQNKPVQFFSEFGLGFGYAVQKDLNLEMESDLFTGMGWYVDPITSMNIYQPYSFKYYSNFRSRYSNALLLELGTGVRFKTIKKQNVEFKLSYQNTRGNINYTTTRPYAKAIEGYVPSFLPTEIIDLKALAPNQLANDYGAYKGSMSNHNKVYDNLILALNGKSMPIVQANKTLQVVYDNPILNISEKPVQIIL